MSTSYIYSSSRVKALEKSLLSDSDVDRLLSSTDIASLQKALKDTYLGNFISGEEKNSIFEALEKENFEAKTLLEKISPEPDLLNYFWLRFDIHNLKVIIRAKKTGKSLEEVAPFLSKLGKYDAVNLFENITSNNLDRIDNGLRTAYERALKIFDEKGLAESDLSLDKSYFLLAQNLVEDTNNNALAEIIKLQIDLYNLKTGLRVQTLKSNHDDISWFVKGGSFPIEAIDTKEKTLAKFNAFGGEKFWKEAIDEYSQTGHFTSINIKADDYLLSTIKGMDSDVFSIVTLVAYFLKKQNLALNIQAIVTGKENGQSEEVIRKQLRAI